MAAGRPVALVFVFSRLMGAKPWSTDLHRPNPENLYVPSKLRVDCPLKGEGGTNVHRMVIVHGFNPFTTSRASKPEKCLKKKRSVNESLIPALEYGPEIARLKGSASWNIARSAPLVYRV